MPRRMEMKDRIRQLRKAAKMKQGPFAEALGVTQPTVSRWENGADPEYESLAALRDFAAEKGLPFLAFDSTDPARTVMVYGYVGAGAEVQPFNDTEGAPLHEVEVDFPVPPGTGAVIVRGDSMFPVFEDGDLIGYYREGQPPDDLIGRTCVVRLADQRMFIKRLRKGSAKGLFTLTSANASDIEDVAIEWAGSFRFRIPRDEWRRLEKNS